jgi:hypothetical protein
VTPNGQGIISTSVYEINPMDLEFYPDRVLEMYKNW